MANAFEQVRGHVELPNGERLATPLLYGKWDEAMYVQLANESEKLLWEKAAPPREPTRCNKHAAFRSVWGICHCMLHFQAFLYALLSAHLCCRYNLTRWAIQLNEITPGLQEKLAPTDCRLRPDQHYLELGEYDQVSCPLTPMLCMGPPIQNVSGQLAPHH
jgi:hypothetical protein